jgi:hypothetical protein
MMRERSGFDLLVSQSPMTDLTPQSPHQGNITQVKIDLQQSIDSPNLPVRNIKIHLNGATVSSFRFNPTLSEAHKCSSYILAEDWG